MQYFKTQVSAAEMVQMRFSFTTLALNWLDVKASDKVVLLAKAMTIR